MEEGKNTPSDIALWILPILPASYLPIPNPAKNVAVQRESTSGFGMSTSGESAANVLALGGSAS
jgi:hypothetical protein